MAQGVLLKTTPGLLHKHCGSEPELGVLALGLDLRWTFRDDASRRVDLDLTESRGLEARQTVQPAHFGGLR